jgi:hypothetical protein
VSDRFDHLEESEREWLRASRRSAARRSWLLIGALVVVALVLAWLTVNGLPGTGRSGTDQQRGTPATTTPEQRAVADAERALADWGRFAVTNDLAVLKESFWPDGPQYKQLAAEARTRDKALGPPPYQVTMSDVQVLAPRPDQRVLRGNVHFSRPGEEQQAYAWDVWLRVDPESGDRWRLWTVRETAGA